MNHPFVQKSMLTPFGIAAALTGLVMCTSGEESDTDAGDSRPTVVPVRFSPDSLTAVAKTQPPPTMNDVALTRLGFAEQNLGGLSTRAPIEFTEAEVEPIVVARAKSQRNTWRMRH